MAVSFSVSEEKLPTIPVIVVEDDSNPFSGPSFLAFVASNPDLRAEGRSEDLAVAALKRVIFGRFRGPRTVREIDLSEILVEEVMRG